ncbi:8740_t:CDS:2, partial [Gigaspora margarita]
GLKNKEFLDIGEIAINYYNEVHHNDKKYHRLMSQLIKYKARAKPWNLEYSSYLTPFLWWEAIEDENLDLQELAKTMFTIVPSQANCEQSFFILKWFTEEHRIWLQVPYALNKTIFAEIDNLNLNNCEEEEKNEMNTVDLTTNNITMAFQDLVNLSDPIFGVDNNQVEPILTEEETEKTSIEFESRSLVQDILSNSDLYE